MQQQLPSDVVPAVGAAGEPELSVVIVTPGHSSAIRQTLRHLQAQTGRDRIEVILAGSSRAALDLGVAELAGFHSVHMVELGAEVTVAAGNAAGVRAARAPVVALSEDHCFPAAGWAEVLLAAHRGSWAVVGPVIVNANPGTAISWADYLLGYGPWLDPTPAGVVGFLPGHNSAYKRHVLLEYGAQLEEWLESEAVLHWDLRSRGYALYLEPAARAYHTNFSRPVPWLRTAFLVGRTFAGRRLRGKRLRPLRRLLYAGVVPLIPLVRAWRVLRDFRRSRLPRPSLLRVAPAVLCQLVAGAVGEAAGYVFGAGAAPRRLSEFEFNRDRHVTRDDRAAMSAARFYQSEPAAAPGCRP